MDLKCVCFMLLLIVGVLSQEANEDQPSLRIIPKSAIINVGNKRAIYCEGNNLPDGQAFQWITPSGSVLAHKSNKNTRVYLEKNKLKGNANTLMAALVINTAIPEDSGNWTCKADELQDTIEVFVGVKMNLSDVDESIHADEGKTIQFDCISKGEPVPSAQWYKNGIPLPIDPKKYKVTHTRDRNTKLEIRNLNHMDSGEYACKLTQKLFMTFAEKKVQLSVKHKPILLDKEGNEITNSASVQEDYAILNEIKVLKCSSKAFPPAKYTWYKRINNYDEHILEDELEKEPTKPISVKSDPTGDYSDLILMMRDESFLGEYKCVAKNDQGTKQIIYHITLGEKPPAPDSIILESANYTEVTFNVTCSNCTLAGEQPWTGLTVNDYNFQFVEYKEGFLPDWESESLFDIEVKIEDPNDTMFVVGPLPNSTKFHVRVRSRNQAGYSDWLEPSLVIETSKAVKLTATFVIVLIAYFIFRN